MRLISRLSCCWLAVGVMSWGAAGATAAPLAVTAAATSADPVAAAMNVGWRRYRDDDDDDAYFYPPEYYRPPPRERDYRYAPPPVVVYEPPEYGWIAPPPPSNCGKYRYWNGEYCADARYEPPYVGPRW